MALSKSITIFVAFVFILRSSLGAPLPRGAKAPGDHPQGDIGFKRIGTAASSISFASLASLSNYASQKLKQFADIIRDIKLSVFSAEMSDEYEAMYVDMLPTATPEPEPGLENIFVGWKPSGEYDGSKSRDKIFIPYLYYVARALMPTSTAKNNSEGKKEWAPLKFLYAKTVALLIRMGCLEKPVIERRPCHSADQDNNRENQATDASAKRPGRSVKSEAFTTPSPMWIEEPFATAQPRTTELGTESKQLDQSRRVAQVEYKRVSSSSQPSVGCGHHHLTPVEIGDLLGPVPSPYF